jgi:hypothetical protein
VTAVAAVSNTAQAVFLAQTRAVTATFTPSPTATETLTPTATATDTPTLTATRTFVIVTNTPTPIPFLRVVVKNTWDTDVRVRLICGSFERSGVARDFSNPAVFLDVPSGTCTMEGQWGGTGGRPTVTRQYGQLTIACIGFNTFELEVTRDGNLRSANGLCYNQ